MKKVFFNWKQNGSFSSILAFKNSLTKKAGVVFFVPYPYFFFARSEKYEIGAQNVSAFKYGSFTGEVGALMLKDCNVKYCLIGHSERRKLFSETNKHLSSKIQLLKEAGIVPVLCIGENLEERKSNNFFDSIKRQMEIFESNVLVAYEPVWSIGTGLTPHMDQIQEIGEFLCKNYLAPPLYGGSVSSKNSKDILGLKSISGILVGGASLNVFEANKILNDNSGD